MFVHGCLENQEMEVRAVRHSVRRGSGAPAIAAARAEMTFGSDAQDPAFRQDLVDLLPNLRRFARRLTGSAADGDDLVQAACVRALANAHRWQPGSRLDSWMFRIIQNLFTDGRRAAAVRKEGGDPVDPDWLHGGDTRIEVESALMLAAVRRAVARLPADQRRVLMLVGVEGMSYRDTASALDIPVGTVMSRLSRARLALARQVFGPDRPD